jgi:hypothetical protein
MRAPRSVGHIGGMPDRIEGQTVRVTTKRFGGSPLREFYSVAEPDPRKAEAIIGRAIGMTPDVLVEAVGSLSAAEIKALGLKPGQFAHHS